MLTAIVAISFFLIKEIVSITKYNTIDKSPITVLRELRVITLIESLLAS